MYLLGAKMFDKDRSRSNVLQLSTFYNVAYQDMRFGEMFFFFFELDTPEMKNNFEAIGKCSLRIIKKFLH